MTWRQWLLTSALLAQLGMFVPMLTFAKVIVWLLAVGAFGCFLTGSAVIPEQKERRGP